jgi:glycosyltransferase involved in cell wall biosynthesis
MQRQLLLYSDAPIFGGAERHLLELARMLPRNDYDITVVLSEEGSVDHLAALIEQSGVRCRRLPAIPTLQARGAFVKVWRFFMQNRFDVTHFQLTDARSCTGAMTAAVLALKSRFITTEHLPRSVFDDKPLPRRVRTAASHVAHTITATEADRAAVRARPWNKSQVHLVANGVADDGPPSAERRAAARRALGFEDDQLLLAGFMGRLIPQKNPDLFVEALRRAAPVHPQARFLVFGDGPLLPELQRKCSELGFGEVVRWYGFRDDARELLQGLDLFVSTSHVEAMPYCVLEAMSAGLPVLGMRISGLIETVADRASGVLVPPGDGDILGGALIAALSDRDRLRRYGAVGRERALLLFDARHTAARTAEIYALSLHGDSSHAS